MKILFLLLAIISCGKNTHKPITEFELSLMQEKPQERFSYIPETITFRALDHKIHFQSTKRPTHDFFEASENINRYYSFELTHLHPDTIYRQDTVLPDSLELYLHDQNKDILIHPENFKMDYEILERLINKKSYIAIRLKKEKATDSVITIRHFTKNETIFWTGSIEEYLAAEQIEASSVTSESIINHAGDNYPRWWLKKSSPLHYQIIYTTINELKEDFQRNYLYFKNNLKRTNGQGGMMTINAPFFKVSGFKVIQDQRVRSFTETYYTQIGELPYVCYFQEASAQVVQTLNLSLDELKQILGVKNFNLEWNSLQVKAIPVTLENLSGGFFNVGLISRKCPTSMAPKVNFSQVNREKELELVIESYLRRR